MEQQKQELTPRQSRFVVEYSKDRNASRAARAAGYSPRGSDVAGVRLLGNVRVQKQIAQLDAAAAEKASFDRQQAYQRYCEVYQAAKDAGQLSAAVRAVDGMSKLYGLLTNRLSVATRGALNINIGLATGCDDEDTNAESP